jgi:hypothetical protein
MTLDTVSLRRLDAELEERVDFLIDAARILPSLTRATREDLRGHVLAFLRRDVVDHLRLDERLLYPVIAERLGDPLAAAPLNYEHRAIRWWIDRIAAADVADVDELQRLLYGVHALIKLHLSREEELYAGALDSTTWPT